MFHLLILKKILNKTRKILTVYMSFILFWPVQKCPLFVFVHYSTCSAFIIHFFICNFFNVEMLQPNSSHLKVLRKVAVLNFNFFEEYREKFNIF